MVPPFPDTLARNAELELLLASPGDFLQNPQPPRSGSRRRNDPSLGACWEGQCGQHQDKGAGALPPL